VAVALFVDVGRAKMDTPITYNEVCQLPQQRDAIIRKIRKGKGKFKESDPSTWTWVFMSWVTGRSLSLSQVFGFEPVEDFTPTVDVALMAKCGGSHGSEALDFVPLRVMEHAYPNMRLKK
jgi:hypothetical protein